MMTADEVQAVQNQRRAENEQSKRRLGAGVVLLGYAWFTGIHGECIGVVVTNNGYEDKAYIGVTAGLHEDSEIQEIATYGGRVYSVDAAKMLCKIPPEEHP